MNSCRPTVHLCVTATFLLPLAAPARAATYTLLNQFRDPTNFGSFASGSLVQSGDLLYGTTQLGGSDRKSYPFSGDGTIYSYNTTTNTVTTVHSFSPEEGHAPVVPSSTSAASSTEPPAARPSTDL